MIAWLLKKSSSFVGDRRGTVALIFELMSFAFLMFSGVAIYYGRVILLNKRMISDADAATRAAGGALRRFALGESAHK